MKHMLFVALACLMLTLGQSVYAGTVTYVYSDPQGTPLAEADSSGNVTATFDYRPYGAQALGAAPNGPGYTGHVNDPEVGLVYMQARYYDPVVGRFLSVDPLGLSTSTTAHFSRYAYGYNNPVNNADPDGKCPWCWGFVAGAAVEIIAQRLIDPHKDIDWRSVGVSAVAGAATGGIASIARVAAIRGTISVGSAVARTAIANAAISGAASAADNAAHGEAPDAKKVAIAAGIGGATSGLVGASGATKIFAEKIEAAAIGTPAGIGNHIAATTNSATVPVVTNVAITVVSENAPDVAASMVDKKIEDKIDKNK